MPLIVYSHPASAGHVTPPGHPERVARVEAVEAALADPALSGLDRREAPAATRDEILRVHPAPYVDEIMRGGPDEGFRSLDPDTHMSAGTLPAALHAAGANVAAVDAVMGGEARAAFCATRPPGHHAEKTRAMGFCFFANASIGARHAMAAHGLSRVAIADFDVHHGNGTQDVFWDDPSVVFCSSHQSPLYPGTGMPHETGAGNIFNATLAPMSGGAEFRAAWEARLLPAIDAHAPELIIVSAGFDAHRRDPLANLNLEDEDFAWITRRLCALATAHCGGRIVSTLEGGYDLAALTSATAAHLGVLREHAA